jgi:hypothetical protein
MGAAAGGIRLIPIDGGRHRWKDLARITVPAFLPVGRFDEMNVADIQKAGRFPLGRAKA